jgi:hypothetical protein
VAESYSWVSLRSEAPPERISEESLVANFAYYRGHTHLVPERIIREYEETSTKLVNLRAELRSYKRPSLRPHATEPGIGALTNPGSMPEARHVPTVPQLTAELGAKLAGQA